MTRDGTPLHIAAFVKGLDDALRDTVRRGDYGEIILPLTVLRRLDAALAPTRAAVLEALAREGAGAGAADARLCAASGYPFYNTSRQDAADLLKSSPPGRLAANLLAHAGAFSENAAAVLDRLELARAIEELERAGLLALVARQVAGVDLSPAAVSHQEIESLYEELLRRRALASGEHAGAYFTPPDVVRLMVALLRVLDEEDAGPHPPAQRSLYDPCCGSGRLLLGGKERLLEADAGSRVELYGQELNPRLYALCKAELLLQGGDESCAERIALGDTLLLDGHAGRRFDWCLANPPFGASWQGARHAVEEEARREPAGRFGPGLPRTPDGQLLFLLHVLAHMKAPEDGGGIAAIVLSGSALAAGDAGSGESEIRRYVLENDLLVGIVGLPEGIFYATGIATYVWLLANRKAKGRRNRVQLINAVDLGVPMRRPQGEKRRELSVQQIAHIADLLRSAEEGQDARILEPIDFGYRKIVLERPLRLNFQVNAERLARLAALPAFQSLPPCAQDGARAAPRVTQQALLCALEQLSGPLCKDRAVFAATLDRALEAAHLALPRPLKAAVLTALAERDETAEICRDGDGRPEADPLLREYERVPLRQRE